MLKKYKNIIIAVAIIAAGFVAYTFFFTGEPEPVLSTTGTGGGQTVVEQELISLLLELRTITLDTRLLDDPRFQSLRDFNQELIPEPTGRQNPFAPI